MIISELLSVLQELSPFNLAEDFDNVGLLAGNSNSEITKILVSLDTTEDVVDEAIKEKANTIVSFHPIIFQGLKSLTGKSYVERVVIKVIQNNISIIAVHTALDNVPFGVNHEICKRLGVKNAKALIPKKGNLRKLLTYVPKEQVKNLKSELFKSGAGEIGNYDSCSFSWMGSGTFRANENANPFVGNIGELHSEEEIAVNVVFATHFTNQIIKTLHQHHPYETPAYEIYDLVNGTTDLGMGRIGELDEPMNQDEFLTFVKKTMKSNTIRHSNILNQSIQKVAVLGGSGSFAIKAAIAQKADAFITADLKYHNFFEAENKILLMDIGHYESEQYTKNLLVDYLSEKFPNFAILNSNVNTNPVNYF